MDSINFIKRRINLRGSGNAISSYRLGGFQISTISDALVSHMLGNDEMKGSGGKCSRPQPPYFPKHLRAGGAFHGEELLHADNSFISKRMRCAKCAAKVCENCLTWEAKEGRASVPVQCNAVKVEIEKLPNSTCVRPSIRFGFGDINCRIYVCIKFGFRPIATISVIFDLVPVSVSVLSNSVSINFRPKMRFFCQKCCFCPVSVIFRGFYFWFRRKLIRYTL